jgi:hypothetical protein
MVKCWGTLVTTHHQRIDWTAKAISTHNCEMAPGASGWGHFGMFDKERRTQPLWVFIFTLGYSRSMIGEIVFDQKFGTLLHSYEEVSGQFGSAPEESLYDQMTTV